MHIDQQFVDGLDAYVWIYDPIPIYYWFFGALLVLGATGVCLFPLWPPSVRYFHSFLFLTILLQFTLNVTKITVHIVFFLFQERSLLLERSCSRFLSFYHSFGCFEVRCFLPRLGAHNGKTSHLVAA